MAPGGALAVGGGEDRNGPGCWTWACFARKDRYRAAGLSGPAIIKIKRNRTTQIRKVR